MTQISKFTILLGVGNMLERRNVLIFNKTISTSNTCENYNVEIINHVADFMRMTKHDLNNAEPAEFTTSSRCLWNRVCLELLPQEFWKINLQAEVTIISAPKLLSWLVNSTIWARKSFVPAGILSSTFWIREVLCPDASWHGWRLPLPLLLAPWQERHQRGHRLPGLESVPACFSTGTLCIMAMGCSLFKGSTPLWRLNSMIKCCLEGGKRREDSGTF